jgi:hypothetical protein
MASKKPYGVGDAVLEFGATGLRQFSGYVREEWLRSLIGRRGMLMLREMRDNDPIISAILMAVEMLLRPVPFRVKAVTDGKQEDEDAADFVQSCFADMEHSWADFMADALSFLQYGFGVYEVVYKYRRGPDGDDPSQRSQYTDGKLGWRKFAGRAQETLLHWTFQPNGDPISMVQLLPTGGPLLNVPLSKCLHFRTTPYKNNPEGRSILRSMYEYYYLKKRVQQIEAIGVSRDLCGMPVVTVPSAWFKKDASEDDKAALAYVKEMVNLVNNNEQSGMIVPAIYDANKNLIFKVELLATGGRRQFATTEIIGRYDHGMTACMMADFITLGQQHGGGGGMGGHGAQSQNKTEMFNNAVIGYLDIISSEVQRGATELLRLNAMKGQVTVTHGDIAKSDLMQLGQYITDIATAGALVPDDTLEAHLREEAGLPAADNPTAVSDGQEQDQQNQEAEIKAKEKLPPGMPGAKPASGGTAAGGGGGSTAGGTVGKRRRRKPL